MSIWDEDTEDIFFESETTIWEDVKTEIKVRKKLRRVHFDLDCNIEYEFTSDSSEGSETEQLDDSSEEDELPFVAPPPDLSYLKKNEHFVFSEFLQPDSLQSGSVSVSTLFSQEMF